MFMMHDSVLTFIIYLFPAPTVSTLPEMVTTSKGTPLPRVRLKQKRFKQSTSYRSPQQQRFRRSGVRKTATPKAKVTKEL
jgi:hypothetical protein